MLTVRLRRFVSAHQYRFVPLLITIGAGSLSLFLTVRACRVLSPADSALVVAALGTLCEVAKLSFGPRALLGFLHATQLWERVGYLALGALVLVLMAGSVGASFVFTTRIERQVQTAAEVTRAQALVDSDAYKALTDDINTHAVRIAGFMHDARELRAVNRITDAEKKDKLAVEAQAAKDAAFVRRAALHGAVLPSAVQPSADAPGEVVRWVHLMVAMVLELVGIAACVLVHTSRPAVVAVPAAASDDGGAPLSGGGTVVPIGASCQSKVRALNGLRSVHGNLVDRCLEARRLIESGQLDPSLEALARTLRISQRPATRLLKTLCNEGVIRWAGNRYLFLMRTTRIAL